MTQSATFDARPNLFDLPATIPYLIAAPKYNPASAGIRALHMLCHSLNLMGQKAYLTIYPQVIWDDPKHYTNPDLLTPVMTPEIVQWYERQGRPPIVVYPEPIAGNPLKGRTVVRWLLNYAGLLGGDTTFASEEILYAYSRRLAESVGLGEDRVIFLPTSDPSIFFPPPAGTPRSGSCFYASKYQRHHHGTLLPITENSFEITRDLPDSLTKQQIADLFRRSEVFYTYEDTALAIEACLCGCPAVFIPNDYLSKPLGFDDLGMDGFAWGTAPEELQRAKATVQRFPQNYRALIGRYWDQLGKFVDHTQAVAEQHAVVVAKGEGIVLASALKRHIGLSTLKRHGLKKFIGKLRDEVRKRGFGTMVKYTFRNSLGL